MFCGFEVLRLSSGHLWALPSSAPAAKNPLIPVPSSLSLCSLCFCVGAGPVAQQGFGVGRGKEKGRGKRREGFGQMLQQGWGWEQRLKPMGGIGEEQPAAVWGVWGSILGKGDSIQNCWACSGLLEEQ